MLIDFKYIKYTLPFMLLILFSAFTFVYQMNQEKHDQTLMVKKGEKAPIEALTVAFTSQDQFYWGQLNEENSPILIVNFFSSWCSACQMEHELLKTLKEKYALTLVGVNFQDSPENMAAFLSENGNPFDILLIDDEGLISVKWGIVGVPETFVINQKDHKVLYKHLGPLLPHHLTSIIDDHLHLPMRQ